MPYAVVRPDTLYAWSGPSLLVVNTRGECAEDQRLSGYYFREARFIRTLQLRINGRTPWPCEAASIAPDTLAFTYIHPEITTPGGGGTGQAGDEENTDSDGVPERAVDLRVTYTVRAGWLDVRTVIANRARKPLHLKVSWTIAADFADIQEAEWSRPTDHHLGFRTRIDPEDALKQEFDLAPQQSQELVFRVWPSGTRADLSADDVMARHAALDEWRARLSRVESPANRIAEQIIANNIRDFASFPLLDGDREEWLAHQAGMPLYPAFFGRDAVTAGWQAGMVDQGQSLSAALVRLGRMQSNRFDEWRDEEPGRVPYQMRTGPLAIVNENPYSAYYADFASPLMFVISLANLYAWVGDLQVIRRHWDAARRILDWARQYGDRDGDGYLEYLTRSKQGTKNQGWKDSGDAIIYDDGSPVPPPIATCELQGYWYVAQYVMGVMAWMLGARDDAKAHWKRAAELKERFNRDWWIEDEGFFALAMDRDKRLVRAVTSNVGHCLATGIIDTDHLRLVVDRLFAPDMFSGWGIRTLSSSHAFYNPLSYHRGTVWAVEQATILFGLRRFGFGARAHDLAKALFDLAQLYPEHRIPECVGGYPRSETRTPGAYPRANTPQLWNATAITLTTQVLLGLLPLAPFSTLVVDPELPEWLPDVVVHDLRVADARVTLRCWRTPAGKSHFEVLRKAGTLHVVRQAPPEADAGFIQRAQALAETAVRAVS
ncbi:MAG TPA: glycogen debranching N-terminal domain-containing protein [Vicinamibacterales bacterium]|nr:glycogen debranching N-terminal domain-containing protein [Vicinamibacterales bacterium]